MRRIAFLGMMAALACWGGEHKPLPGQAGNDDVELEGNIILGHEAVTDAIGSDIGEGYVVVHIKVTPKGDKPLRVGPDDFTIISRKDGERSEALAPTEIAGKGALVVKQGDADGSKNGWGAMGVGVGLGSSPGTVERNVIKGTQINDNAKASPALAALKEKVLPEKETKAPVEGLLYFSLTATKLKAKDVSLVYKGEAGRLEMDFENPKKSKK